MTNDNNNIKELVTEDDDLTVELEILSIAEDGTISTAVSSSNPAPTAASRNAIAADSELSELESTLHYRNKLVGRLQFDNSQIKRDSRQLRTMIECRDRQLSQLNEKIIVTADLIARKDRNIERRDLRIEELASDLRQQQNEIRLLRHDLRCARSETLDSNARNNRLASELHSARESRAELERVLGYVESQSSDRIAALQEDVQNLTRSADRYKQKLLSKGRAVSALLAQLKRKSLPQASDYVVEESIYDLHETVSEEPSTYDHYARSSNARLSRVLIGTVDDQELRFPLFKKQLTIGRTQNNDIQLNAALVSRRHAVIQTDGAMTRIIDWGSKTGIYVNQSKMSEHFLRHGDTVTIGSASFRYEERRKRDN